LVKKGEGAGKRPPLFLYQTLGERGVIAGSFPETVAGN